MDKSTQIGAVLLAIIIVGYFTPHYSFIWWCGLVILLFSLLVAIVTSFMPKVPTK